MSKIIKLICAGEQSDYNKHTDLYLEELKELKKRKFRKILEQEFQLETLGEFQKGLNQIIQGNKQLLKERTSKLHNNGWIWITINPKPSITLDYFRKKVEKLVNRNLFTEVCYVYEQRGTTLKESGKGFHAHILAKRNLDYKPFKVAQCIQNTCKTLVKNVKNNNLLNIQHIGEDYKKDKMDYILGEKTGDGKDQKQLIDIQWRKKHNISIYYNAATKTK